MTRRLIVSEQLKPGLYKATVRDVADMTVLVDSSGYGTTEDMVSAHHIHATDSIKNARPLIVLDVDPDAAEYIIGVLRNPRHIWANRIADQIEAQTKPARIPEPKQIGSLVTASASGNNGVCVWTKYAETGTNIWISPLSVRRAWSELIDPEPFPFGGH